MKTLKKIIIYISKKADLLIKSILSPQVLSILLPIILGTYYHENIIDTITNTQAKVLLQKDHLDPLQYQITETWIATNALLFLLNEYSKPEKNSESQKESLTIRKAFSYWKKITDNWKNEWYDKFDNNLKDVKGDKEKLRKQFDNVADYFKTEFFDRLNACYRNYYSKSKSCITPTRTLPLPANVTEFQKKIYLFYIDASKAKEE